MSGNREPRLTTFIDWRVWMVGVRLVTSPSFERPIRSQSYLVACLGPIHIAFALRGTP